MYDNLIFIPTAEMRTDPIIASAIVPTIECKNSDFGVVQKLQKKMVVARTQTATKPDNLFTILVQPPWAFDLSVRSSRIVNLTDGWDGPRSVHINQQLIEKAQRIIKDALMPARRPSAPYLVPGGDGSLQIEWHTRLGDIELDLSPTGEVYLWGKSGASGDEFEADDEKALDLFSRWASRIAEAMDNERYVPSSSNTSIYGSEARLPLFADDTVS